MIETEFKANGLNTKDKNIIKKCIENVNKYNCNDCIEIKNLIQIVNKIRINSF